MHDAIVTLQLDGETKTDTIYLEGETACFVNIPHRYLGKKVRITFLCQDFIPLDTMISLNKDIVLRISRDPSVYGNIQKLLWLWREERGAPNTDVRIDRWETTSDTEGMVRMVIPLEFQKENYIIEIPSWNVTDTVFMPCAEGQIIELEQ